MRLIDADALADSLFEKRKNYPQWVADTIGAMPDAIVRCKDCKDVCIYGDDWVICTHIDSNGNDKHHVDWFCADGERRLSENDE